MLTKPLPHKEARERIAGLPRVSREVMDDMLPELKAYAFTITGLDVGDQMARVQDTIAAVPAGEKTWAESKKEIAAELAEALGGKVAERRAELLLRTHVFRGYAATRYRTLMEQVDVFPYWQYKTHGDGNVRPSHMALNGKIFPAGHQIWQRIFPPWDWGCRCLVVPLTAGAVKRMQDAGLEPQANEDDTLLKTQIVRPEVYDKKLADVIEKSQRLPNGVSLNPSQTWAGAPWSMPGNIRHDWPLIEARYADQPEVLAAFKDWAKGQKIDKKTTIWTWIAGKPKAVRKPKAKPTKVEFPEDPSKLKEVKKLGGSTGAMLMKDGDGNLWVMKKGASADHLREEVTADDLYRAMGALVPEAKLYETAAGPVKLAKFVEGQTLADFLSKATPAQKAAVFDKLGEHFHVDALMGNWDVVGLAKDNILVDAAGVPWRIDNGGSLRFRAMGKAKGDDWNEIPDELFTLRDAAKNPQTAEVFGGLRLVDIARRIEADNAPLNAPEGLKLMLERRRKNLRDVATKALDMEHDGWRDSYGEELCSHIFGLRKAGISADLPKQIIQAAGDVTVTDENGLPWDHLRRAKAATSSAASSSPDPYWGKVLNAVKTLNHHANAGDFKYNASTVAAALDLKPALEKMAKGKTDKAKMAKFYLTALGDIEAAVQNSQNKTAKIIPNMVAWKPKTAAASSVPKTADLSLVERLRDYIAAQGGNYDAVIRWKAAQAGDSWNHDAQAKKAWAAMRLNIPAGDVWWRDSPQTAEKHLKTMQTSLGKEAVDKAFAIHHAFVQELLAGTEIRHNDRAARAMRLVRTEMKAIMATYGAKPGQDANFPRGLCESSSAFSPTSVFGTEVTIQAVPHSRILGTYLMERTPGKGECGFLSDGENEFTFVSAGVPLHYAGNNTAKTDMAAGDDHTKWKLPTSHLRKTP